MKKLILLILLYPLMVFANANDPFENKTWKSGALRLTTHSHALVMGYDHSLSYFSEGGSSFTSDECSLISSIGLRCSSGDTVTLNLAEHSATLTPIYGDPTTYYEEGFEPSSSIFSGHWHAVGENAWHCLYPDLAVPYAPANATVFPEVIASGPYGFQTYNFSLGTAYNDHDHVRDQLYFGSLNYYYFFLFDGNDNPIMNVNNIRQVKSLKFTGIDGECKMVKIN